MSPIVKTKRFGSPELNVEQISIAPPFRGAGYTASTQQVKTIGAYSELLGIGPKWMQVYGLATLLTR